MVVTVWCRHCGGELAWHPGNVAIGVNPWTHRAGVPNPPHKPEPPEEAPQPR